LKDARPPRNRLCLPCSADWTGWSHLGEIDEWTCLDGIGTENGSFFTCFMPINVFDIVMEVFRTIVNGSTLFLCLFHGLLEVCAAFMPISIKIQAPSTFLTPKNSMKKQRCASNFVTLPTIVVPEWYKYYIS
jgi:hypothetical protein